MVVSIKGWATYIIGGGAILYLHLGIIAIGKFGSTRSIYLAQPFLVTGWPRDDQADTSDVPDGWMGLVVAIRLMRRGATFLLLGLLNIAILGLTR